MVEHGLTRAFVNTLVTLHREVLEAPKARQCMDSLIADGVAVGLAGAAEPGPTLLAELALSQVGTNAGGGATLLAREERLPSIAAARVNGAAMHVLDFEPMWNPANHAVSTVLPALMALAETEVQEVDGQALAAAFAIGIEAQTRLRRASRQFEPGDLVFHPPGVVGPVGAAIACGLLLRLDEETLVHAAGIAASRAGGILINVGSMTKALHCGAAASDGLEATLLAARGFTADIDALDGLRGYLHAFFGAHTDRNALTTPALPAILDPGPAFKFYPSQYGTHFVIAAALSLRADMPHDEQIQDVTIICPPMPYVDRPAPLTGLAGKFSFQYVAAAALLDGHVTLGSFTDARRFATDMEEMLSRIIITPDPVRKGRFDEMHIDIVARLTNGATYRATCNGPPGIWGRPAPERRRTAKIADCLHHAGMSHVPLSALYRISELSASNLRELLATLGRTHT